MQKILSKHAAKLEGLAWKFAELDSIILLERIGYLQMSFDLHKRLYVKFESNNYKKTGEKSSN